MKLFQEFIKTMRRYREILLLTDIRPLLSNKQKLNSLIAVGMNVLNSVAKILAPASLGKAVEMFAKSQDEEQFGFFSIGPRELLFASVFFATWTKIEIHLKNALLLDIEESIIKKQSLEIIKYGHQLPIEKHEQQRSKHTTMLMEIINLQFHLPTEVVINIYQVLVDVLLGSVIIWRNYGGIISFEFFIYGLIDILLFNNIFSFMSGYESLLDKSKKRLEKYLSHEYDILNYEETVRLFNRESFELDQSTDKLNKLLDARRLHQVSKNRLSFLKLIPILIANIIPVTFILKDDISVSDLDDFIFLLAYVNLSGANILSLSQSMSSCSMAYSSFENMRLMLSQTPDSNEHKAGSINTCSKLSLENSFELSFENVWFTYPGNEQPTLKGVSFTIPYGTKVGLIGHSNAGKSTLVKLIYGIHRPQVGTIKLNGNDIKYIPKDILYRVLCCVPQTVSLFGNKSIIYNVLYGASEVEAITKYLKYQSAKRESDKADSQGYQAISIAGENNHQDTYLKIRNTLTPLLKGVRLEELDNDRADKRKSTSTLSGGQLQRLMIARALIHDPKILIVDEATSGLDSFTETDVVQSINSMIKARTLLMISHRMSVIRNADKIIVFENGQIVEEGAPQDLLEGKGLYHQYCTVQMGR